MNIIIGLSVFVTWVLIVTSHTVQEHNIHIVIQNQVEIGKLLDKLQESIDEGVNK